MADAIPVHRKAPKAPEVATPVVPSVPADEHDQYIGKDHPEFGKWNGKNGWHKSHDYNG